jgi:hypothetical protein
MYLQLDGCTVSPVARPDWLAAHFIPVDATIERFRTLLAPRFDWRNYDMGRSTSRQFTAIGHATALIREVCQLAGTATLIDDCRVNLAEAGVLEAVRQHDDAGLFAWLMDVLSYQGVADSVAYGYMEHHGRIAADAIAKGLKRKQLCPKLGSYWQFHGCGYRKTAGSCAEPDWYGTCPLPRHRLRNGRLNQTAYSLFLFCRDVAQGDLVAWLDRQLADADLPRSRDRGPRLAAAVVEPLTYIHGVSDKVLSMSLSMLLLAGDPDRERWQTAGAAMVAIDTLVHNWLHRTGLLRKFGAGHLYGPHCYAPSGCADIIRRVSKRIDARAFNPDYPRDFPRFVQYAIWWFCAQDGLGQCNGNRIADHKRCGLKDCELYGRCGRVVLHKPKPPEPIA